LYGVRDWRKRVEKWVDAQPTCPSRKDTQKRFPDVPKKLVRAAVQSRKDRERS